MNSNFFLNFIAGTYSINYNHDLSMKNFNADMTNPNIYEAVKDHVYDEIKHKEGYQPGELLLLNRKFLVKNISCKNHT